MNNQTIAPTNYPIASSLLGLTPQTPATNQSINQPTQAIAAAYVRWAKNRAFIDGEEAVKSQTYTFLPRANPLDTSAEYHAHLDRTGFLPAASKIAQGLSGLIFRKKAQLNTNSQRIQVLSQLITPQGESLDDLAEWVVAETLITNFTGLLVDHPDRADFQGLSAANEIERGYRPRIAGYSGESILEVTPGLINNARTIVRVRLLEDDDTVLELALNQGIYEQRLHRRVDGTWTERPWVRPTRNSEPLTEIPFVLISTSDKLTPTPSILQHSVDLNLQHYRVEGLLTSVLYFLSAPIPVVTGLTAKQDADGNDIPIVLNVTPGAVWVFPEEGTKAEYLEFKGQGAQVIENKLKSLKDELSTVGHSILAPEKAAPEAPEYGMIRKAAENAILAGFARTLSRKLERVLRMFASWADPQAASTLAYSLNTDFMPASMSPQEMTALMGMWQAGAITHETLLYALRDGEIVSPTLDVEAEVERTRSETADRPPVV